MGKYSLAPGVRFHPTDVELVMYYLKRKVLGKKLAFKAIAEVDIYKHDPLDLPDMSCLKTRDLKWFFYCPVEKKYARGARVNRATVYGYWKTTGKDRIVEYNEEVVGMIKSLVFHRGKAPCGERTDWVMHEYRLAEKKLADRGIVQDTYVLCAVFKKDGVGPKNGARYGAPFKEEDWSDDEDANLLGTGPYDDSSGLYTQPLVLDANATVIDTAGIVNHGYAAPTGSVDEDANLLGTGPSDGLSGLYTQPLVLDATATVIETAGIVNHGYAAPTGSVDEDANLLGTGPSDDLSGLYTQPLVLDTSATVIDTAGIVNHGYAAPTGSVDEDANLPVTYSLSSMSTLAVSGASSSCVPESQSLGLSVESNGLSTLPQVVHADAIVSITADIHSSNYAADTCVGAPQVPVVADGKAVPVLLEAPQFALAPKVEESNGSISSMLDLFTVEDAFTTYDRGQMTGNADDSFCSAPQFSDDDDILSMLAYFDEDNNLNNLLYPYE